MAKRQQDNDRMDVRKHLCDPWLELVASGHKRFEGRLRKGYWASVAVGDHVTFWNEQCAVGVRVRVAELFYYNDFGAAFDAHGRELLPQCAANAVEARAVYAQYFADDDVSAHGVVVLRLEPTATNK